MKKTFMTIGFILALIVGLGLIIDTGSVVPPDNALVFINPSNNLFYPPNRVPVDSNWVPASYAIAKKNGAKPYDSAGFNVDGPPVLLVALSSFGLFPELALKWTNGGDRVQYYK